MRSFNTHQFKCGEQKLYIWLKLCVSKNTFRSSSLKNGSEINNVKTSNFFFEHHSSVKLPKQIVWSCEVWWRYDKARRRNDETNIYLNIQNKLNIWQFSVKFMIFFSCFFTRGRMCAQEEQKGMQKLIYAIDSNVWKFYKIPISKSICVVHMYTNCVFSHIFQLCCPATLLSLFSLPVSCCKQI